MNEFAEKLIHGRVHVSPKRLGDPGPDASQKNQILLAANAAPDHGRMMPLRFVVGVESGVFIFHLLPENPEGLS